MRRQKRDRMERAFQKGYMAGVEGKSKDSCPKVNPTEHQEWLNGWREGRVDNWDGLTGVRGIHRIAEITMR
ncbi:ribosome modulation factor [Gynuella sunshinyii]|uniref:Ribosome modulation factor n=1 Tax=Gynuella sunshinyii YC6258 TaxID=1445510 RepID=A0A0C5VPG6_9GAMM|nr:ribosome modulation factor [Gynuella sunshinyii]AJQ95243.1 ribosome modulation factor [Gynuella sunshinyii YC6258]